MGFDKQTVLLLQKDDDRSTHEAEILSNTFRDLKFFNKLMDSFSENMPKDQIVIGLWQHIKYEIFNENELIFREKDKSNEKMYVIISGNILHLNKLGKVAVYIQQNKNIYRESVVEEVQINDENYLGETVATLGAGFAFGEQAIKQQGGIRSASILALTNCEALVIMRQDFLKIKETLDLALKQKLKILKQHIPKFNMISNTSIQEQISYNFHEEKYSKGDIICHEGGMENILYILVDGVVDIGCKVTIDLEDSVKKMVIKLAEISSQERLGDEIVLNDKKKPLPYNYTIKVKSQKAKVLAVKKKDFWINFPQDCKKELIDEVKVKETYRYKLKTQQQNIIKNKFFNHYKKVMHDSFSQQMNKKQPNTFANQIYYQTLLKDEQEEKIQAALNKEESNKVFIERLRLLRGNFDTSKNSDYINKSTLNPITNRLELYFKKMYKIQEKLPSLTDDQSVNDLQNTKTEDSQISYQRSKQSSQLRLPVSKSTQKQTHKGLYKNQSSKILNISSNNNLITEISEIPDKQTQEIFRNSTRNSSKKRRNLTRRSTKDTTPKNQHDKQSIGEINDVFEEKRLNEIIYTLPQTWDLGIENFFKKEKNIRNQLICHDVLHLDKEKILSHKPLASIEKYQLKNLKEFSEKYKKAHYKKYAVYKSLIKINDKIVRIPKKYQPQINQCNSKQQIVGLTGINFLTEQ